MRKITALSNSATTLKTTNREKGIVTIISRTDIMVAKISTQPELSLSAMGEGGNIGHVYDKNRSESMDGKFTEQHGRETLIGFLLFIFVIWWYSVN